MGHEELADTVPRAEIAPSPYGAGPPDNLKHMVESGTQEDGPHQPPAKRAKIDPGSESNGQSAEGEQPRKKIPGVAPIKEE